MTSSKKLIRHRSLKKLLRDNPFSTDEQLAKMLDVSVQTIRLDRVALGIPELRARTRTMAEEAQTKLRAIDKKDIVGELLDLELNKIGISTLKITPDMVLERTRNRTRLLYVRHGQYFGSGSCRCGICTDCCR